MSKVIFLDYDGVVNTPIWYKNKNDKWICGFASANGNVVNNEQAVQWLSEIYEKLHFDGIVVTSTWRLWNNYGQALIKAGLRDGIKVIGRTPEIRDENSYSCRGKEIRAFLDDHKEITDCLIIDDEEIELDEELSKKFIKTDTAIGITEREFEKAEKICQRNLITNQDKGEYKWIKH